jgi:tetratricopeptide (TPR) repeat protein
MTDPLASAPRPAEGPGGAGEDARIEQLLVTGLDQYFAGEFEAAINLWTRVLFLDRHHDRARAYIERARSAQAERQRQHEALVHQGLDAFDSGDVERARLLLSDALDRGASHDLALGVLGRIDRLDVGVTGRQLASPAYSGRSLSRPALPVSAPPRRAASRLWMLSLVVALALGGASWWMGTTDAWPDLLPSPAVATLSAIPETAGPNPVPTVAEAYLRRGRALFESGRLRDALLEFDRVPMGDPLRADADDMRARIQRELLALALIDTPAPAAATQGAPPE